MQKSYLTLLLSLVGGLSSLSVRAQADFQPGYIVRPAGDTVRGQIDYRDAYANAKQCRYRSGEAAPVTVFGPGELRAYGIPGEQKLYRALVPPVASPAATIPATPYFMEALVSGPANLYYLRAAERRDYYYVATATFPLTELISRQVRVEQDGKFYTQQQAEYRTTLAQALPGCPAAQAKLPSLVFDERALKQVVATYNLCLNPPSPTAAAQPTLKARQRARLGILLGLRQTRLSFDNGGNAQTFYQNLDFDADTGPVLGLALQLPLAQFSRKLSLELELYYEGQKYSKKFDAGYIPAYGAVNAFEFDLAYARLPILLRYTFPRGRVRPLLEAGPTLAFALKTTNTAYNANATGAARNEQVYFAGSGFRRLELGVSGGAGVQFEALQGRRVAVLARYERSNGFSGFTGLGTPVQRGYLLLTVDLAK